MHTRTLSRWWWGLPLLLGLSALPLDTAMAQRQDRWNSRLDTGFNYLFGQRDLLQFTFRSTVTRESDRFEFSFGNRIWFGFSDGKRTVNYGRETFKFDYRPNSTWSPFTFVSHTYDQFRRIRTRVNSGIGAKYTIVGTERLNLSLSEAILFEYENARVRLSGQPQFTKITNLVRSSERVKILAQLTPTTSLSFTVFHQPSLGDFRDIRITEEFAVTVDISQHLALKVVFDYEFDNKTVPGVSRHFGTQNTQITVRF